MPPVFSDAKGLLCSAVRNSCAVFVFFLSGFFAGNAHAVEIVTDSYGQYYAREGYLTHTHYWQIPAGASRFAPAKLHWNSYIGTMAEAYIYPPTSTGCGYVFSRIPDANKCTPVGVTGTLTGGCFSNSDEYACMPWYGQGANFEFSYRYAPPWPQEDRTLILYVANNWCPIGKPVIENKVCNCPGVFSQGKCRPSAAPDANTDRTNDGAPPGDGCGNCGGQQASGTNVSAGDPIHLFTGNMFHDEADIVLPSGLSFTRYNNSSASYSGRLGNWRGDWISRNPALRLSYVAAPEGGSIQIATARVYRPDGRMLVFTSKRNSANNRFLEPWVPSSGTEFQLTTIQPATSGAWTGLRLYLPGNHQETFNASLQLTGVWESGLKKFTPTWSATGAAGTLTSVTDWHGNVLSFDYNSVSGMLIGLTVNGSPWAAYTYDSNSRLSAVTYADGSARHYAYEHATKPLLMTSITDERGLVIREWAYDADGKGIQSKLGGGQLQTDIVRNADGTVTESLPNGLQNVYQFADFAGRKKTSRKDRYENGVLTAYYETTYDAMGNAITERDWNGNITQRVFDGSNRETSRTEGYGTAAARTVTTDWDATPNTRRPITITATDTITAYTYNQDELATRTETDRTAWSAGSRTTSYTYDAKWLVTSVNGPRTDVNDITTYAYTATLGRLASVTNALGQVTTFDNYTVIGLPQTMTDPNGNVTHLAYDARGRLLSSTFVDPVEGNLVTGYTYDAAGNLVTLTLPDSSTVNYAYNANNDVMAVEDATGARIEYERDLEGNITRTHVRDANGYLVRRVDQAWDAMKRLVSVSGVSALRAAYTYDANGNRTAVTDALNHTTLSAFDALDRLVSSTDALNAVIAFSHDAEGNLASVSDARNLTTSYEYDGLGCLRRQTSPDTGITLFTCDAAGNVITKTDARGQTVTYHYDALNRRTAAIYSAAPAETALYGYDATAGGNAGVGRLTSAQNDGATVALRYDARGNVIADTRTVGGVTYTTHYDYDAAGRPSSILYPTGRTVAYARNAAGEITAVTTWAAGGAPEVVVDNLVWEADGPLAAMTHGNGVSETRSYDADGYLVQIAVTGAAGTLFTRSYARDLAGRITGITDSDSANNETYNYDSVDRLTDATGPYGIHHYDYDDVGNRIAQDESGNSSAYSYGSTSNRLYQITGNDAASLDYDAAGNTTIKNDKTFAYNAANRLSAITLPGESPTTITFTYSALGERVTKTSPTGTTHFHYDRAGHLIAETDNTGATIREYLWLGDTPIGLVATQTGGSGSELFAVHTDHLATTLRITDNLQQTAWKSTREPFGESTLATTNTVIWPLRFPGQYEDNETGFVYNYFRDYDPVIGRYVESDPIGLKGGINTYSYVSGNPVGLVDPYGLDAEAAIAALPAAAAIAMADSPIPGPADLAAGLGLAALALIPGDSDKSKERAITQPPKPNRGVTCTCRAAANGQQSGNCPDQEYAFGTATAPTYREARAEAERIARKNLGKQAKHTQCKCTDSKGNPVY